MLVEEILSEGFVQVWGRKPRGKLVRRYKCTSGDKKGRVVAKPSTCATAIGQKASNTLRKTRRTKNRSQQIKRAIRLKHPTSIRLKKANKSRAANRLKSRHRRKSRR